MVWMEGYKEGCGEETFLSVDWHLVIENDQNLLMMMKQSKMKCGFN